MVVKVTVGEKTCDVDDHDGRAITIDGQPLTQLGDDPAARSRYALETEILAADWEVRERAQTAFSASLRRQMARC